ncbi:hypothetical protein JCM10213_003827 [Rhodosporidiobolus nylandii]
MAASDGLNASFMLQNDPYAGLDGRTPASTAVKGRQTTDDDGRAASPGPDGALVEVKTTAAFRRPTLPNELISRILSLVSDASTLVTCTRTSRVFGSFAEPRLYSSITLNLDYASQKETTCSPRSFYVYQHMLRHPRAAAKVKELVLDTCVCLPEDVEQAWGVKDQLNEFYAAYGADRGRTIQDRWWQAHHTDVGLLINCLTGLERLVIMPCDEPAVLPTAFVTEYLNGVYAPSVRHLDLPVFLPDFPRQFPNLDSLSLALEYERGGLHFPLPSNLTWPAGLQTLVVSPPSSYDPARGALLLDTFTSITSASSATLTSLALFIFPSGEGLTYINFPPTLSHFRALDSLTITFETALELEVPHTRLRILVSRLPASLRALKVLDCHPTTDPQAPQEKDLKKTFLSCLPPTIKALALSKEIFSQEMLLEALSGGSGYLAGVERLSFTTRPWREAEEEPYTDEVVKKRCEEKGILYG